MPLHPGTVPPVTARFSTPPSAPWPISSMACGASPRTSIAPSARLRTASASSTPGILAPSRRTRPDADHPGAARHWPVGHSALSKGTGMKWLSVKVEIDEAQERWLAAEAKAAHRTPVAQAEVLLLKAIKRAIPLRPTRLGSDEE